MSCCNSKGAKEGKAAVVAFPSFAPYALLLLLLVIQYLPAVIAITCCDEMVMGGTLGCLVARLFAGEMIFAYQPQLTQQFQRAVHCGKAHERIALLHTLRNLFNA